MSCQNQDIKALLDTLIFFTEVWKKCIKKWTSIKNKLCLLTFGKFNDVRSSEIQLFDTIKEIGQTLFILKARLISFETFPINKQQASVTL